ncbi:mechanosensitive ion channel [bacterium]|nr:mechanosensitive ion channel [bacterium]
MNTLLTILIPIAFGFLSLDPLLDQAISQDTDPPTLQLIKSKLSALENSPIDEKEKLALQSQYTEAEQFLQNALDSASEAEKHKKEQESALENIESWKTNLQQLEAQEKNGEAIALPKDISDLQKVIDVQSDAWKKLTEEKSELAKELALIEKKPLQISNRLSEIQIRQNELKELIKQTATGNSALETAQNLKLRSEQHALAAERKMLSTEDKSIPDRQANIEAKLNYKDRKCEIDSETLDNLRIEQVRINQSEAEKVISFVENFKSTNAPDLIEAAANLKELVAEDKTSTSQRYQVNEFDTAIGSKLKKITLEYDSLAAELELGSGGQAMAKSLLYLQSEIHNGFLEIEQKQPEALPSVDETFALERQINLGLRKQKDLENRYEDSDSLEIEQLLSYRKRYLDKLREQYKNLTRDLAILKAKKQQFSDKTDEIDNSIKEKLLGMRTTNSFNFDSVIELKNGIQWASDPKHGSEFLNALLLTLRRSPIATTIFLTAFLALALLRIKFISALVKIKSHVRKISTDQYYYTWQALLLTVLMSLPGALLFAGTGIALSQIETSSGWLDGLAHGLKLSAVVIVSLQLIYNACRKDGLGDTHFHWNARPLALTRRVIRSFTLMFIPAIIIASITVHGDAAVHFGGLGRIMLIFASLSMFIAFYRLFRFSDGILAEVISEHPLRIMSRLRFLWFPILLSCPIAISVLAFYGYTYTALQMGIGMMTAVIISAGGVLTYSMIIRWFAIRYRRLALAEALEKRRLKQQQETPLPDSAGDRLILMDDQEEVIDLASVGDQARELIRLLVSLATLFLIALAWSQSVPIFEAADNIKIPVFGSPTLLSLIQAGLVIVVTYGAVQNLSSLIELVLSSDTRINMGTRTAITTLCQYGVIAIGIAIFAHILNLKWAQFGWIVTALSVGLGFGLQEVVANFVCGLILLFERPIRAGDIVTVEGTTGKVVKINMRATIITNWDRQDLVVPNKTLITGSFINWTLTASINRVQIIIGIAYGSDTQLARKLLVEIANEHPSLMQEPPPISTFDGFGDSALTISLRAYLPDLEDRLKVITELHTMINQRFAEHNIEIPFPQRDLHLRSGWPTPGGPQSPPISDT